MPLRFALLSGGMLSTRHLLGAVRALQPISPLEGEMPGRAEGGRPRMPQRLQPFKFVRQRPHDCATVFFTALGGSGVTTPGATRPLLSPASSEITVFRCAAIRAWRFSLLIFSPVRSVT